MRILWPLVAFIEWGEGRNGGNCRQAGSRACDPMHDAAHRIWTTCLNTHLHSGPRIKRILTCLSTTICFVTSGFLYEVQHFNNMVQLHEELTTKSMYKSRMFSSEMEVKEKQETDFYPSYSNT